jgi:protein involved in polysaccharide export with SLBB domain
MNLTRYFLAAVCSLCISSAAFSQTTGSSNKADLGTTLNLSSRIYTDEAGLQLLTLSTPLDGFIDADTYQLGPLDVISVYGSGSFEFAYRGLVVNASGDVSMPTIGLISVKGLSLTEATDKIKEAFSGRIKNTEVSVTVDQPKPVAVHVGGDVPLPGKHNLPPGARSDFLISGYLANTELIIPLIDQQAELETQANPARPSFTGVDFERIAAQVEQIGSDSRRIEELQQKYDLRNIEIKRASGETELVDLYGYYKSGNLEYNPYLHSGDRIIVKKHSSYAPRIGMGGAVQIPFDETFHPGDTIKTLLEIAGGYLSEADSSRFIVKRQMNGALTDIEVSLSVAETFVLQPNDRVLVPFSEKNKNAAVWVYGEVAYPGIYPIEDGESTLARILDISGGLREAALVKGAYIERGNSENRGVSGEMNLNMLTRSSDQYLEGFDYFELESALNPNRFPVDLSNERTLNEIVLRDGDKLYIPRDEQEVTLIGQFERPGRYPFSEMNTKADYIRMAGGLTLAGDNERVILIKAGSRAWKKLQDGTVESGDIIFADRIPFEDVTSLRAYQIQRENLKNNRVSLILAAVSTIATAVTTIVVVTR